MPRLIEELCDRCKSMVCDYESMESGERINCMAGRSPKGRKGAEVMLVGEAPGRAEAGQGIPFCGAAGKYLAKAVLSLAGVSVNDLYIDNAVRCRPAKNRTPTELEIRNCRPYLEDAVKKVGPKVIIAAGATAWYSLTGLKGVTRWQGTSVWSGEFNCWVMPTLHPAALLRSKSEYDLSGTSDYIGRAVSSLVERKAPTPQLISLKIVRTEEDVDGLCRNLAAAKTVAVDTETADLSHDTALLAISISTAGKSGQVIPVSVLREHSKKLRRAFLEIKRVVMHNCAFDLPVLARNGIRFRGELWDTMLMHHLVDENAGHKLKELAWRYTGLGGYEHGIAKYLKKGGSYADIPFAELATYAAYDAVVTYHLYQKMREELVDQELEDLYIRVTSPARFALNAMEKHGAYLDVDQTKKLHEKLGKDLEYVGRGIRKFAARVGHKDINPKSSQQMSRLLYGTLKLRPISRTKKTKRPSVDKEALEKLQGKHPVVGLLRHYKKIAQYQGTYIGGFLERVRESRIHTHYLSHGTVTGRTSSADPNLQNVPRDKDIRALFVAPKGRCLVDADYNQVELRVLSMYSQDARLLAAYRKNEDVHSITASRMYSVPLDKVTKPQRDSAKPVNFGISYGLQAYKLSKQLGCTEDEAQGFIEAFFTEFRGVLMWIDEVKERAHRDLHVRNVFGRVRRLPLLDHDVEKIVAEAERQAVNMLIQSTASECTMISLARVHRRCLREKLDAFPVLTVHDNIGAEAGKGCAEYVAQLVKEEMERPIEGITVPLVADVAVCDRWGEHNDSLGVAWAGIREAVSSILSHGKRLP